MEGVHMRIFKAFLIFAVLGAIAGAIVATILGRVYIGWYSTPAYSAAAQCPCAETARGAINQLIAWQLTGAAVGAVALLIATTIFHAGRRRRPLKGTPGTHLASGEALHSPSEPAPGGSELGGGGFGGSEPESRRGGPEGRDPA
jgi:hypothetical protein